MNMFNLIEQIQNNSLIKSATDVNKENLVPTVLEAMGQEIRRALKNNEVVTIVGIGKLLPVRDKVNTGINRVRFRSSKILKTELNPPNNTNINESVTHEE